MRQAMVVASLCMIALSGCVGGEGTLTGKSALNNTPDLALGAIAIEGPFDIERALELAEEEAEQNDDALLREILDTFDFRRYNGANGDGKTGSWFSVSINLDRGVINIHQLLDDGSRNSITLPAEYMMDFADETHATTEPSANPLGDGLRVLATQHPIMQPEPVYQMESCLPVVHTREIVYDSDDAMIIINETSDFSQHVLDHPEAEFTYVMIPSYGAECVDETSDPMFIVAHTDLDTWVFEDQPASAQEVVLNARTGEIIDEGTYDIEIEPVEIYNSYDGFRDGVLAATESYTNEIPFDVPVDGKLFVEWGLEEQPLNPDRQISVVLLHPDGTEQEPTGMVSAGNGLLEYVFSTQAEEGEYTLIVRHNGFEPLGEWVYHTVAVLG